MGKKIKEWLQSLSFRLVLKVINGYGIYSERNKKHKRF